jgi:hypothetical protein
MSVVLSCRGVPPWAPVGCGTYLLDVKVDLVRVLYRNRRAPTEGRPYN